MDSKPTRVYEDFVPKSELVQAENSDTLQFFLPGFNKEQLKVQLTREGMLRISGERPMGENKWQRFQKEFAAAENLDKSKISSKFEKGVLYVIQPKLIPSASKKDKESAAKEAENTPAAKTQTTTSQKENADTNTPAKEEPKNSSPKTSEQTEAKSPAEKKLPADESSSYSKPTDDATPTQVYEDFLPSSKVVLEQHCNTLHLDLPGIMKISGQRPIGQNQWQRFQMEFAAAENCDKSKISSKFENGILHVIQPKLIPSASKKDKESAAKEAENTPAAKTQTITSQKDNANTNTPAKEEPKNSSPKTSEQTEAKSPAEKKLPADESSSYSKPTANATPTQVYEDFVPSSKLVQEQHSDTLRLDLPGFKKDQLKVQLTSGGILRISGQRTMGENKWQRFQKEFAAAENLDKSKISSKFEKGVLHVIQPKLIPSALKKDKEPAAKEAENTPAAKTQTTTSQKENADTNTPAKEEPKNNSPKTTEQKEAKSPAEKKLPADESSSYSKPTDDATPTQVYEDFVPSSKLVQEQHSDTLHLDLPGFKKKQVMVQLTKTGMLKISGQRPIGQNKWQRFQMEFAAAENCDKSKISEKFENGILYVKQPKMITSPLKKDNKLAATGAEKPPAAKRKTTTSRHKVSKKDNADIDIPAKEEPKKYSRKTSDQTEAKRREEKKLPADESSSSSSSSSSESTDDSSNDEVAVPTQVCEDFMPSSKLFQDEHFDTLHLNLPDDSSDDEVAVPTQVYEDFMLSSKLVQDEHFDTLHLNLPDDSSGDEVAAPTQVYEDFMPSSELFQEEHFETLHVNLPDDSSDDEVAVPTQVYEDFMPSSELFQEEHFETLHVNLPDYVTDDETIGNASCLAANLKKPRKMMKMALCLQRNEVCKRS